MSFISIRREDHTIERIELTNSEVVALEFFLNICSSKIGYDSVRYYVKCTNEISRNWLDKVLKEAKRWYLNDFKEEVCLIISNNDIDDLKELSELISEILAQNKHKRDKFVSEAQSEALVRHSELLSLYERDDSSTNVIEYRDSRVGYPTLSKKILNNIVDKILGAKNATVSFFM